MIAVLAGSQKEFEEVDNDPRYSLFYVESEKDLNKKFDDVWIVGSFWDKPGAARLYGKAMKKIKLK